MVLTNHLYDILTSDYTTLGKIRFCTEDGEHAYDDTIYDAIMNGEEIVPRYLKTKDKQISRKKNKGEVFTPLWVCNKMNNNIDKTWFETEEDIFNQEREKEMWIHTTNRIKFPEGKTWQDYVLLSQLEITCGEAPFMVMNYDPVTGTEIPLTDYDGYFVRAGLFDRKMRVVIENIRSGHEFIQWSLRALKKVYGFEYQGDNLFIARMNLLKSYAAYYELYMEEPLEKNQRLLEEVCLIISINFWQMDGFTYTIPDKNIKKDNKTGELIIKNGAKPVWAKLVDWKDCVKEPTTIFFYDMAEPNKTEQYSLF